MPYLDMDLRLRPVPDGELGSDLTLTSSCDSSSSPAAALFLEDLHVKEDTQEHASNE